MKLSLNNLMMRSMLGLLSFCLFAAGCVTSPSDAPVSIAEVPVGIHPVGLTSATGYSIDWSRGASDEEWSTGFQRHFSVANGGTVGLTNWAADFDLDCNVTIGAIYEFGFSRQGQTVTITPKAWNKAIPVGTTLTSQVALTIPNGYGTKTPINFNFYPGGGTRGSFTQCPGAVANKPPVAAITGNSNGILTGPGIVVKLSGSSSTDADTAAPSLTYSWLQLSPATPILGLTQTNQTDAQFTTPAVSSNTSFVVQLTVSDGTSTNATSTTIVVGPAAVVAGTNLATAVAAISATSAIAGQAVTLLGGASHDNNTAPLALTYLWTQTNAGNAVAITNATNANATFTVPAVTADTTLTFNLKVTTSAGSVNSSVSMTAQAKCTTCTTSTGLSGITASSSISQWTGTWGGNWTITNTNGYSLPNNYVLQFDLDCAVNVATFSGLPVSRVGKTVSVTVGWGEVAPAGTISIYWSGAGTYVAPSNIAVYASGQAPASSTSCTGGITAPTALIKDGNTTIASASVYSLDGSASSDPQSQPLTYLWTTTGGTLTNATTSILQFNAPTVSTNTSYTVTLKVTNTSGLFATASTVITVTGTGIVPAPTASAGAALNAASAQTVKLLGAGSDPSGLNAVLTYAWTQTGGTTVTLSSTSVAQPTFTAPTVASGTSVLTFKLTVTDSGGSTSASTTVTVFPVSTSPYRMGGYYEGWQNDSYSAHYWPVENINPKLYTHLYYAFGFPGWNNVTGHANGSTETSFWGFRYPMMDCPSANPNTFCVRPYMACDIQATYTNGVACPNGGFNLDRFAALQNNNNNLVHVLSLGGWSFSQVENDQADPYTKWVFPAIAGNVTWTNNFADDAIAFLHAHNLQGLDIDWEYPKATDKANYTLFMQRLYTKLHAASPPLILTAAWPANPTRLAEGYDVAAVIDYVDHVNIMSYDFYGTWVDRNLSHAQVTGDRGGNNNYADYAAAYLVNTIGSTKKNKLSLGVGMYGRAVSVATDPNFNSGTAYPQAVGDGESSETGFWMYSAIMKQLRLNPTHWQLGWDTVSSTPYAWNNTTTDGDKSHVWIGFADTYSIDAALNIVKNTRGLGGAFVWAIDQDDSTAVPANPLQCRLANALMSPAPCATALPSPTGTAGATVFYKCATNSDCPAGANLSCQSNLCKAVACSGTDLCKTGFTCTAGFCQ